jgi:hypothetical protein
MTVVSDALERIAEFFCELSHYICVPNPAYVELEKEYEDFDELMWASIEREIPSELLVPARGRAWLFSIGQFFYWLSGLAWRWFKL